MCNTTQKQDPDAGSAQKSLTKEIQVAQLQLELATARSNAEYNASPAGQMQRQFEALQRVAKPFAEGTIVPAHYKGNIGNCIIAVDLAFRMNLPPLMVMKELYVVNGSPSWSSKFLVACINKSGRFTNIRYRKRDLGKIGTIKVQKVEWKVVNGKNVKDVKLVDTDEFKDVDNWECVAYCTEKATGETLESDPVTIEMAIKEGWYTKDGSKWVTMPQLMLTYRAAAFWQRTYAPEISMGFPTIEEVEDTKDVQEVEYEDVTDIIDEQEQPDRAPRPKKAPTATASVENAKEALRNHRANNVGQTGPSADDKKQSSMFDMP